MLKSIKTETVFTETEMNDEGNVNFLQNNSFSIQQIYPTDFIIYTTVKNSTWIFSSVFKIKLWIFDSWDDQLKLILSYDK